MAPLDAIVPIEQSRLTGARTELHEGVSHFDWIHPGSEAFTNVVKGAQKKCCSNGSGVSTKTR
ncbi:MAG: hypothetical protein CM1200mP40_07160 [Gammaproteobacteria bacterium]|nr:MAG: hypothetical protein CM1200mP40_07160 [Gammaproteobacteria bacterium]